MNAGRGRASCVAHIKPVSSVNTLSVYEGFMQAGVCLSALGYM